MTQFYTLMFVMIFNGHDVTSEDAGVYESAKECREVSAELVDIAREDDGIIDMLNNNRDLSFVARCAERGYKGA